MLLKDYIMGLESPSDSQELEALEGMNYQRLFEFVGKQVRVEYGYEYIVTVNRTVDPGVYHLVVVRPCGATRRMRCPVNLYFTEDGRIVDGYIREERGWLRNFLNGFRVIS